MAGRALTIDITTRDQQTLAALKRIQRELGQLDKSLDTTAAQSAKVSKEADEMGRRLADARQKAGTITLGATVATLGLATNAAGNLAEAQAKSNAVFKESSSIIDDFADEATDALALSRREALESSATFGNLFTQLGMGTGQAAEMSKAMITLGGDFAAFHNANPVDVIDAQTAAFRGEYDALQRYVPTINAAAVQKRALADTGKTNAKALTDQEKALATYNIMLENAGDAEGAAAREADGLAMSTKRAKAELENAGAEIGEVLVPVAAKGAQGVAFLASTFALLPAPVQTGIVGIGGLTLAAGLLAPKIAETARTAKAAVTAVRALGAEGSSAGSKLAGAATGVGALTAAVTLGVAAWEQWRAQGQSAIEEWATKVDQANGRTVEGMRKTSAEVAAEAERQAKTYSDGWFSFTTFDPGDFADMDWNRATEAAIKESEKQSAAFATAADNIEEAAQRMGMSVSEVEEAISSLALDPLTLSTDQLVEALGKNRDVTDQVTGKTDEMADAQERAKRAIDANREAADRARSAFEGLGSANDRVVSAQAGVVSASKRVEDAERGVADARRGVTQAVEGLASAEEGLEDARRAAADAAEDLADAERELRDGSDELRDAQQGVVEAEQDLAEAQRESLVAQEDLIRARERAAEQLEEMVVSVQKAALDERDAIEDLKEARRAINEGPRIQEAKAGETAEQAQEREKRNAEARAQWEEGREKRQIRLERAEIRLKEATKDHLQVKEDVAEAEAKGVEGSDVVVAAKEAIEAADGKVVEAEEGLVLAHLKVAEAQEAMAARVVEAQGKVEAANRRVRDAANQVRDAHEQVAAAQQRVNDQRGAVVEARRAVQEAEEDLTAALVAQKIAQDELEVSVRNAEGAFDAQKSKLIELASELEPGSPIRRHLLGMAEELNALSAHPWDIDVVLRLQTGELQVGRDLSLAAAERAMGGRAIGGSVGPGQRRVVGESGREILEMGPTTSGRVFTPEQAAVEDRRRAAFEERDRRRVGRDAAPQVTQNVEVTVVEAQNAQATAAAVWREIELGLLQASP